MILSNFILHKDILLIHADIDDNDYIFTVKWQSLEEEKGGEWELKSYINNSTGEKDLSNEHIQAFLNRINPQWNWEKDKEQIEQVIEED
ncbi:hypothetical protein J416_14897 [Gracilibacillus halophilus YIM-C55.5]|uniref:Uncharacterized protein n=1 Tax=Gracilibacillus halophilus YIM-C55.5 TaxID=1308866 RepID=N4W8V7_9BACI|nr:hypothetical protein [Gracilibacillus halophilus]ENH95659.1 hypothetical protein J416_14897 [Gracilibacillus halophilus YIM-C55.5]